MTNQQSDQKTAVRETESIISSISDIQRFILCE
jgi:hypothetical protein